MKNLKGSTGIAAALAALALRSGQVAVGVGAAALCAFPQTALANPIGASIAAGQATISSPSSTQLNVDQKTKIVIIDWKSFNIAAGETTKFNQPGSDALAVNRIGGADPAKILGNLLANGRVVLIDGNGILFGPNAKVNVGALLATTSDATNTDILSGKAKFNKAGNPNAQIINNGSITATSGMVGLVAPAVTNNGVVMARLGQVTLGASNVFTVDFTGDGLISFPVDPNIVAGAIDANGKPVKALVANNGKIEGATVVLSARAAAALVTNVISIKGEVVAKSIAEKGGHIILDPGEGGVELAGATLDASGKNGGGSITVGSADAASVIADKATVLDASAAKSGNGGSVYVNSASTAFHGTAKAKGGSASGDGGKIETSGHTLNVDGARVDTSAPHGTIGDWLLDPYNVTISTGSTSNDALSSGTYTPSGNDSVINVTDLQNALARSDVTITTGSGGSQAGDITVATALTWASSSKLTLDAYHSIDINAPITVSGAGKVVLTTDDGGSGGDYTFLGGTSLQFTGTEGSGQGLTINGASYSLLYTMAEVQALTSGLSGNYALAKPLDATSTSSWTPIGTSGTPYNGVFEGLGNTISNLTISQSGSSDVGLFGVLSGTVRDFGAVGGLVTGIDRVGGLVGTVSGGTLHNVYSTAAVNGRNNLGGLAGSVSGTIDGAYATGNTSFAAAYQYNNGNVGGLVGSLTGGSISNAYATGVPSAGFTAGGLIGSTSSGTTVTNVYSTGRPQVSSNGGGLIGSNSGTVTNGYWDLETTSLSSGAGTPLLTAQLQAGPTGLNASPWLTSISVYPYLNFQTPPPSKTVSGTVYSDYGITPLGSAKVIDAFLTGGAVIATGTSDSVTGAYTVNAPSSAGKLLLFLDNSNGKFADTVVDYSGSNLTGVNLYAGYLNVINTSAVSVSSVLSSLSSFAAPTGGYSASDFLLSVNGGVASLASGAGLAVNSSSATGFTIDQAFTLTGTNGLAVKTSAGDITVSNAVSLANGSLVLDSYKNIAFNAPVTVSGTSPVTLKTNDGGSGGSVSFGLLDLGSTGKLSFTGTEGAGQSLTINGTSYDLIYTAAELQAINASASALTQAQPYALAKSIDLSSISNFASIGSLVVSGQTQAFSGTLDGLNNTVTGLTQLDPSGYAGLFGLTKGATLQDINLANISITVTGTSTVPGDVGGLVGSANRTNSNQGTSLANIAASGAISVSGTHSNMLIGGVAGLLELNGAGTNLASSVVINLTSTDIANTLQVGGLVGSNSGIISRSFATGSVTGSNTVGGFAGFNDGTITQSYATGAVSLNNPSATAGSSNTISGSLTLFAGGFIGVNGARGSGPGTISQSYATGSVSVNVGSSRPSQLIISAAGGGFAGDNTKRFSGDSLNGGTLNEVYSTGYVSGGTSNGGLVGLNSGAAFSGTDGTITNSYWDTETAGQSKVSGDSSASTTGSMATAQLQGTLPSGFNTVSSGVWSTGTGLFPYLGWRYTSAPQAISGTAYTASGTLLQAGSITAVVGGTALDTASTGANGYYYLLAPSGTISGGGSAAIAYIIGGTGGARANTVTGTTTGFDLMGSLLIAPTASATYSSASATTLQVQDASLISAAVGSNNAATTAVSALSHYGYIASGAFTVDQAVTQTGSYGLYVETLGGDITVSNALSLADGGLLLDSFANLNIGANLTVSGIGAVTLSTGNVNDYTFLGGKSLQFTGTEGSGQALTINGANFTILYTMAELQGMSGNTSGNYALAVPLDATSFANWVPIGNAFGAFTGFFEGLGNTVSNLTINVPGGARVGFFGQNGSGTIRDFGLVGGSVTAQTNTGALVGYNQGTLKNDYSTATVHGAGTTGGLVGTNYNGSVTNSFTNGTVTGTGSPTGGLVGNDSGGTITNSYSLSSVTGTTSIGGLIGFSYGSVLKNVYAAGAVNGTSTIGGLVGSSLSMSVTNGYWDASTTGQSTSAGSSNSNGLATANLQTGPTGLNASPWITASGVYPYLNFQTTPVPPTTVSGTVYSDYGVTPLGNANVIEAFLTGGAVIATGTSNASTGVYSVAAPGSNGTLLLFLDNSNGKFADTVVSYSGSNLTGVNLYAGYLNFINTSAVSVSSVLSSLSTFVAPTGGYSANDFLFSVSSGNVTLGSGNGLAVNSSSATGFTVDQAFNLTGTNGLVVTATAGGITVANPVSLAAGNLTLSATGAIAVNAPVTISGAGKVSLTAANDTTTFTGKSLLELTFAIGDGINFGATNNGGSLSINGTAYTLLYSPSDLQAVAINNVNVRYALATSLDATHTSSWRPLATSGTPFSGIFDGLGNTISNLTYTSTNSSTGLFGYVTGTLRNVGLVGGTVTGTRTTNLGSLVGTDSGLVYNAYSSASVSGTLGENGGLIGFINSAGGAANVFFTGKVAGGFGGDAGGLAGELSGQLTNAFSTGAVSGSYSGGLVSLLTTTGKITNGYSTGSVVGLYTSGGLVSNLFGSGSISNGYWDTATSGIGATHGVSNVTNASGVTGLTTSGLQASLPGAWSTSVWGIAPGTSYPYLKSFYPNGVTIITGTAYSDHTGATALAANKVGLLGNGTSLGTAYTGANGYYYDFIPVGTLAVGSQVLAYLSGNTTKGNTLLRNGGGSIVTGLDIYGGYLWLSGSAANLSSFGTSLSTALGSNSGSDFLFALSGNVISLTSGANLEIVDTASSFSIDQAIDTTGTVYLNMGGNTTQTASITASGLALEGAHASFTLTNASNSVGTLADFNNTHTLNFVNSGALTIGTIGSDVGIAGFTTVSIAAGGNLTVAASVSSTGATTLKATGNLTINSGKQVSGAGDVVLSATGNFVNNAGSGAVSSSGGRWLIYSAAPGGDTFGNLDSTNTAVWNGTYTSLPPGSVTATGNRYIFANQPTLTFTSTDLTKIYGTDDGAAVATAYTVSGLDPGVAHAYLADTASAVFSGAPSLSSAGAPGTATVEGGPYAINISAGSLDVGSMYAVSFVSTGKLTVNPATVTITYSIADATSTYGTLATLGAVTLDGVKSTDTANVSAVESLFDSKSNPITLSATLSVGKYLEEVTGLTGSAASNYIIATSGNTYGTLTINPKSLTASLTGSVSKTYNGTNVAALVDGNYSLSGIVSGDTVVLNDPTAGTFDNANAGGGKTVSVGGLSISGASSGNYTLAATNISGAIGTITPAMLTTSLTGSVSKTYNGTNVAALADANYSLSGIVSGDTVVLNDPTAGTFDNANAGGGKTVSVGGLSISGASSGNYTLAATNISGAIGTITPAMLTASLTGSVSKIYNGTNVAALADGNYSLSGIVSGDTVVLNDPTAGTFDNANAGSGKTVSVGGLSISGASSGNYTLATTNISGAIGTITPAMLTASLTGSVSKTYDGTTAATLADGNYSLSGVISGDTVVLNDPTTGTFDTKDTSTGKTIGVNGLSISGVSSGNYTLASTSVSGSVGTIIPKSISASLTGLVSKTYDGTTTATLAAGNYTLSGIVAGDTVVVTGTSGAYADKNAGAGKIVSIDGVALTGTGAQDYSLSTTSLSGMIGIITPAPLSVVVNDASRQEDTPNPSFGVTVAGLLGGDTASVLSGLTVFTAADLGSPVGAYLISSSGGIATNYVIAVRQNGTLTITPRPANGNVAGTNNALPASNTNYNSSGNGGVGTGDTSDPKSSDVGTTGATGTLICDVSNSDTGSEACRATN